MPMGGAYSVKPTVLLLYLVDPLSSQPRAIRPHGALDSIVLWRAGATIDLEIGATLLDASYVHDTRH